MALGRRVCLNLRLGMDLRHMIVAVLKIQNKQLPFQLWFLCEQH
jgi:hypothetical protein